MEVKGVRAEAQTLPGGKKRVVLEITVSQPALNNGAPFPLHFAFNDPKSVSEVIRALRECAEVAFPIK